MSERILDYIKPINDDTNELAGDTSAIPTSHRILDYVKDIQNDTDTIVESGGGGGGGESAGFGTPTATATQLESDQEPTVAVQASGPNTAKVFAFTFGIPKGEKGERGDTGPQGAKGDTGAAAGFGTPTATATQLEPTEQPTVQVSASGDDTAKVFAFTFGIPKGEKGDTGAQGEQGEHGIQGEQGEPGAKGDPGTDGVSAGFGTPTASATQLEAGVQPTVSVQATGVDTAKVFAFSFGIPKGDKGDTGEQGPAGQIGPAGADGADGVTPTITATAEVDNTTGTPTVQVTKSGTEIAPSFKFSFTGIKGETGAKGDTGSQGVQGEAGANGVTPSITANATVDDTAGTPNVQVTKQGDDASPTFNFAFTGLKGETGAKGDKGDKGDIGPQGPQGDIGPQGVAAGFGTPTASASVLEAGASPTVSVQTSGADTAKVFTFAFGIPKGEKGDTGAQGPQGVQGPQGPAGTVTVSQPDYYGTDVSSTGIATYTIPSYVSTNIVEVYLNGFRLELTREYTLSSEGVVTTVNSVNSGGRLLVVVWRF